MNWTVHHRGSRAVASIAIAITLLALKPELALAENFQLTLPASPAPQNSASTSTASVIVKSAVSPGPQLTQEELGDIFVARQRYQAGIEAYKKAPQDSADVLNKMGIAYQLMFDLSDASRYYLASLKISPRNASVLNNLGTTYDALKQYDDAMRMYRRALKYEPHSAVTLKNLGTSLMAEHRYKQGWESYQAALAIDPHIFEENLGPQVGNPTSAENRGAMNFYMAKSCVRAGMNDRAIEFLRLALNEGFTNPRKIEADKEFAVLHGTPAFEQMLAAQGPQ
jgi:tetratricopeptide (TPR) repeat protein